MWETYDSKDFHQFWSSAYRLPEVEAAPQVSADLNLLPYDIFSFYVASNGCSSILFGEISRTFSGNILLIARVTKLIS